MPIPSYRLVPQPLDELARSKHPGFKWAKPRLASATESEVNRTSFTERSIPTVIGRGRPLKKVADSDRRSCGCI